MAVSACSRRTPRDLIALASMLACAIAQAQEKPADKKEEKLQEVVITGSRIARPDLDRLEPTTVVNSESFDERGYTDVGQALQELPAFGVQPSSAVNQQQGFGIAQSFVDLYSLGSQRTLTLINGRRFVSSSTASLFNGATSPGQQVDLNVVPTKLIDRVETVSVGGAPIYGADAIAGTVNIILKKDFEGLDIDAQSGVSNAKDAWNHRVRMLAGLNFADHRGNITGVVEVYKNDGLTGPERASVASDLGFDAPLVPGKYTTVLTQNGAVPSVSTSGIPLVDDLFFAPAFGLDPSLFGVTNPSGQPLAWSPGSSALKPYNLGTQTGNPIFWSGGDGIRLSQFTNLLADQKRGNVDGLFNFHFTDHFGMFAEGWFSQEHATNLIAQPAYNTALFGSAGSVSGNFLVSADNPFLSAADRNTIQTALNNYGAFLATLPPRDISGLPADPNWDGKHFYVSRANTDLQSGHAVADQTVMRGVLGVNGDFAFGERSFNWEVAANYGYSRDINRTPAYVFQNLQNALNATTNASGQIVCAGTPVNSPVATASSTCAPLNIFGAGQPSKAAVDYITHNALATSIDTQRDATANLTGPLFKLPAGDWKFAVGYEWRRETATFEPDDYYTTGAGQTIALPVSGGYHTNEIYLESLVPIFEPVQGIRGLHQVELEGAVRRVNNSIAGDSTTWTAGLRWAPIEDMQLRGNKTHSIRAPAVTELFLPPSTAFEFANDPCDKTFVSQGTSPATRAKNCAAAGINTATFVSNVINATAQGITSGNESLTSETADSKTFGIVLRPRFLPHFNLSVDYIDISLTNAIQILNLTDILDACYDSPNFPNEPSCTQFARNSAHQIASFQDGFRNAALLDFQGVTIGADWSTRLWGNLGNLELRANWLDTRKLVQQVGSEEPQKLVGELATLTAAPHGKGTFDLNYKKGPFQWYWQALYIGPFNFNNQDTANTKNISGVSHWWVLNTTLTYDFTRSLEVRAIVNNVANKEPPFPGLAGIGGNFESPTSLYWSGIIGRTYLLAADFRF
jgi:iron complex outermembrane receptor protein